QVFLKLASLDFSRVQQLEGKEVPEISEFAFDYGFECNENQECIVQSLPELRTMVIRTESGDQEVKEEFQNFVVVRVKKIDETAPQNAVQPVSAVTPVGQAF